MKSSVCLNFVLVGVSTEANFYTYLCLVDDKICFLLDMNAPFSQSLRMF